VWRGQTETGVRQLLVHVRRQISKGKKVQKKIQYKITPRPESRTNRSQFGFRLTANRRGLACRCDQFNASQCPSNTSHDRSVAATSHEWRQHNASIQAYIGARISTRAELSILTRAVRCGSRQLLQPFDAATLVTTAAEHLPLLTVAPPVRRSSPAILTDPLPFDGFSARRFGRSALNPLAGRPSARRHCSALLSALRAFRR